MENFLAVLAVGLVLWGLFLLAVKSIVYAVSSGWHSGKGRVYERNSGEAQR